MRYKIGNVLWGLAFIGAGVGVAGNMFNLWDFNFFFSGWWTLFIIIPCTISIIQHGFSAGNSIGLALGVLLLLSAQNIFPMRYVWKMFWPAMLIIVGLAIIFGRKNYQYQSTSTSTGNNSSGQSNPNVGTSYNSTSTPPPNDKHFNQNCGSELVAVFCGNSGSFNNRECHGAACTAVFGGVDLDLRGAIITRNITVNATAIFGGVDIFVDENVQVQYRSTPIFGGTDCNIPPRDASLPTVFINCVAIFGGIDIK